MGRRYRGEDFEWSEAAKNRAAELYAAGTSSELIANELGCSRNAVIGKMRRMGVASPNPHGAFGRPPKQKPEPAPRLPKARPNMQTIRARSARQHQSGPDLPVERFFAKDHVAPEATRKTFMALSGGDCRFPCDTNSEGATWFCGARQVEGMPYCGGHCRVAYQSSDGRARKRGQYEVAE